MFRSSLKGVLPFSMFTADPSRIWSPRHSVAAVLYCHLLSETLQRSLTLPEQPFVAVLTPSGYVSNYVEPVSEPPQFSLVITGSNYAAQRWSPAPCEEAGRAARDLVQHSTICANAEDVHVVFYDWYLVQSAARARCVRRAHSPSLTPPGRPRLPARPR